MGVHRIATSGASRALCDIAVVGPWQVAIKQSYADPTGKDLRKISSSLAPVLCKQKLVRRLVSPVAGD